MSDKTLAFNPPPGWPTPPPGWRPPKGWTPDPGWPPPPAGWQLWLDPASPDSSASATSAPPMAGKASTNVGLGDDNDADLRRQIAVLEAENEALRSRLEAGDTSADSVIDLDDDRVLQDVGIYRYHHPLENAVAYRYRLGSLSQRIAEVIKADRAIERSNMFTFDGSLAKGQAMTRDLSKLMLRAYNAESENVVRTLRAGNSVTAIKRLESARDAIARLGKMMEMRISDELHRLRIEEIELTADYMMKKEEEREAARAERERLREERKVQAELAAAREKLEKERTHLATVIEKLRTDGTSDPDLEQKLARVDTAIAQNDYRSANIRAGYVYVISNRGAFGGHVVKIGLTRRLDPTERIYELGDASVPFKFDTHAIYFSEDAVTLEGQIHSYFESRRVNWVNDRKEFFFATPAEVREALTKKVGNLLEFMEHAESADYLQSLRYWPMNMRAPEPESEVATLPMS